MCTLIIWQNCWEDVPLLVASNRDENIHRDSEGPRFKEGESSRILSPTDLKAGGTWVGISDFGVFAGITNRFGVPPDLSRRSRGELVSLALEGDSAHDALSKVRGLSATDFNPFHLVICDRSEGLVVWSDGESFHEEPLGKGARVITERSFSSYDSEREQRIGALFRTFAAPPEDSELENLLKEHHENGFEGTCVHVPDLEYATRSSAIIRFGRELHQVSYKWSDGPPCKRPFKPVEIIWDNQGDNCE